MARHRDIHKEEDLSLEVFSKLLPKRQRKNVDQTIVDTINELSKNPDYGDEWRQSLLTHLSILDSNDIWTLPKYVKAIQFTSLVLSGVNFTKTYVRVFPDRLAARMEKGESANDMSGEASRYNASVLVNRIRQQAMVPFNLVNQSSRQEAFNIALDIARHGRSEVARVNAVNTILGATQDPVDNKIEVQVGLSNEAREAQNMQTSVMREIALNQQELLKQGYSIEDVQKIQINHKNIVEAEIDD